MGEPGQGIGVGSLEGSPHPGHRRRRIRIPVSPGNKSPGPEALFLSPTHTHAHFVQEQRSGKMPVRADSEPLAVLGADPIPRIRPARDIECVVSAAL